MRAAASAAETVRTNASSFADQAGFSHGGRVPRSRCAFAHLATGGIVELFAQHPGTHSGNNVGRTLLASFGGGDSGAVWVDANSNAPVALHFQGSDWGTPERAFARPILTVLEALRLQVAIDN